MKTAFVKSSYMSGFALRCLFIIYCQEKDIPGEKKAVNFCERLNRNLIFVLFYQINENIQFITEDIF